MADQPQDRQFAFPQTVRVVFRTRLCDPASTIKVPNYYVVEKLLTDAMPGLPDKGFPGVYTVKDECFANYTSSADTPDNKDELDALALKIATDYYTWRTFSTDRVYNGTVPAMVSAYAGMTVWRMTADDATTRVMGNPWNGEPEVGMHAGTTCPTDQPELCGPPSVSRGKQVCQTKYKIAVDADDVTLTADGTGCCVTICCKSSSSHSSSNCCDAILLSTPCGGCTIAPKQVNLRYAKDPSTGGLGSCDCSDEPLQKTQSLRDNGITLNNVGGCQWHGVNGMATFDLSSGFDATGQNIQYTLVTSSGCSGGTYVGNQTSLLCLCSTGAELAYVSHGQCNAIPLAYSINAIHKCKSGGCTVCK